VNAATPTPLLRDEGGMPLYAQLYSLLVRRLESGEWKVGERMPTLEELMAEYCVARVTVREAMARLEREGVISRQRGRGTHVIRDLSKRRWLILPTDWDDLVDHLERLPASFRELEHGFVELGPRPVKGRPDREYWLSRRVQSSPDGMPYSLTTIHLARSIYDLAPHSFDEGRVLPALRRRNDIHIASAHQWLHVSTADETAAAHLGIQVGDPVVQVCRQATDASGMLIYLADITYAANHLRIETQLL